MRIIAPLLGVVVLLAGCAATEPTPVPTTAVATPTATPTPTQSPVPLAGLPVECSDFVTDEELSTMLGRTMVSQSGRIWGSFDAAALQAGVLRCSWLPVDNGHSQYHFSLDVLPNAADAFAASGSETNGSECASQRGDDASCHIDVLVGDYWLSASAAQPPAGDGTTALADALLAAWPAFADHAVAVVSSAGSPRPAWVAPSSGFTLAYCDGLPESRGDIPAFAPSLAGVERVVRTCVTADDWSVELLPGGAWAMPQIQASIGEPRGHAGTWVATTIAGTDAALVALGDGSTLTVTVGVDLLTVSALRHDGFEEAAAAKIAEVLAAG